MIFIFVQFISQTLNIAQHGTGLETEYDMDLMFLQQYLMNNKIINTKWIAANHRIITNSKSTTILHLQVRLVYSVIVALTALVAKN